MRRLLVLALVTAVTRPLAAQSDPSLMTKAGYWKPASRNIPSDDPAEGPDLEPFVNNLEAVLTILRRTPALAQPRGFIANPALERFLGAPRRSFSGSVRVGVLFFRKDDDGKVVPQDAGPDVAVTVNDPSCVWTSHEVAFVDSLGTIYYDAPRDSGAVRGVPAYSADSSCLVLSHLGVRMFVPVSKERFLRNARDTLLARLRGVSMAALDSADTRVQYRKWQADAGVRKRQRDSLAAGLAGLSADMRKQALAAYDTAQLSMGAMLKEQAAAADSGGGFVEARRAQQAAIDTVRAVAAHYDAEMKGMPVSVRATPAWVKAGDSGVLDLAPAGAENARQLVAPNPALVNPALPKAALQLLAIQAVVPAGDDGATALFARIRETLDFAALAALLK